ncbi:MAG: nicotinate-nucleotide adenylyltransferase [Thalassobaculales bacterium]
MRGPVASGRRGLRIGLLGGSFNPAHDGHRHISLVALKRLRLDQVWWLVSPQNPLKPAAGMAPYLARLLQAEGVARHPRIRVTDLERRLGTSYTADTLAGLSRRFRHRFVWLMGADNLGQMHRWRRWREIFSRLPVAVLARAPYSQKALAGVAAACHRRWRRPDRAARLLAWAQAPAWVFLHLRLHPASATAIRARSSDWAVTMKGTTR